MKKNSGIIGSKRAVSKSSAAGMFDTFDAYNFTKNNVWPAAPKYNEMLPNSGNVFENFTLVCQFYVENIYVNTTFYWVIASGTATTDDFYGGTVSGSFIHYAGNLASTFSINTAFTGNINKTPKTFQIQIRTGSISGPVVYTSGTFTIPTITSSVSWASNPINEGVGVNLQVNIGNAGNFTGGFATISYSGTATSADFSTFPSSIYIFGGGVSTAYFAALEDSTTEGTESLIANVSYNSKSLGSATLNISDTSQLITATVTPSVTSKNEDGTSVVFTVNTVGFVSGTLYWTIFVETGSVTSSDFNPSSFSGSFVVSNSTGTVTLNIADDLLTEGTETFKLQIRATSTSGTVVGTSASITINDTSLSPATPSFITLGTKAPIFGTTGGLYPPTNWTGLFNGSADDSFVTVTSPFSIVINNTSYSTHYMGSNTYITWGNGSSAYSSLSGSNPALNKLHLGSADNSYQRVSTITNGTLYTRIRYEGNASTSGSAGSPSIVLEITIFNPANYGNQQVIEILTGAHNRTGGQVGIATPSTYMLTWGIAANTAYVLVGNSTGTIWNKYNGYVNNSGY